METMQDATAVTLGVLLGACILRASGMLPKEAAAEAVRLEIILRRQWWQWGKEEADGDQPF
jgi:hypothetical protein